jgi:integrase
MAFLKELPDPLRTMIELGAFTGLRRGELIGLRWQDVDFENLILHIRRSVGLVVDSICEIFSSAVVMPPTYHHFRGEKSTVKMVLGGVKRRQPKKVGWR